MLVPSNPGDFEDPSSNFWFGDTVALSGDYAMLGAAFDSGFGNNGAAYIYNLVPDITWSNPDAITYGTALSDTQLNASAGNVPGTFSYSPTNGTVLDAGIHTLTVNFTPTDTARYAIASKTVPITVNQAPLIITADDQERDAGMPNPTLTASYAGFVNGDTAASLDTPVSLSATTRNIPGDYEITASGAADANYAITFMPGTLIIQDVDDYLPASPGIVFVDQSVTGIIETEGDHDRFEVLSLQAGVQYDILMAGEITNDGTLIDPEIIGVFDSLNQLVSGGDDNGGGGLNALVKSLVVDVDGDYQIEVASAVDQDVGSYTLYVYNRGPIDDFLPGGNATMFGNALVGVPALGEIETVVDQDWFAVSLEAGREYLVQVIATVAADGRVIDPALAGIYDINGTFLGYGNDDLSDVVENSESLFIPSQSGTYYIAVMGPPEGKDLGSLSDTGTYSVAVLDIAALTQSFISTNTVNEGEDLTLLVDTIVPSEVALPFGTTGPLNEYIAVRDITVDLTGSAATEGLDFTFLYEFGATQTLQLDALEDELVEDDETVTAHVFGSIDWIIPAESGGTEIDNIAGALVMGKIERRYIDLRVNVAINSAPEGNPDPILDFTFVSPEIVGNVLTNFEDGSGELFTVIPLSFSGVVGGEFLANGDLLISASTGTPGQSVIVNFDFEDTRGATTRGEQEINFGAPVDDYLPGETATVFGSIDVDTSAVGSVERAEDRDRFLTELDAGIIYQIDLTSATTVSGILSNPEIFGVFDSSNNLLPGSGDDDSGTQNDAQVTLVVDNDGLYEIEVGSFTQFEIGGYELSVSLIGTVDDFLPGNFAEVFGTAQIDVPTTGMIELEGDRDRFEVTLQAGIQYNISLEGVDTGGGSLIDPAIYGIFNSQGQSVAGGADNNSGVGNNALVERLMVDPDGIYQIEVGTAQDIGVGDYTLTVESSGYIDDFLPGISGGFGSVTVGGRTTGEIESSGDVDGFRVFLQSNTTYEISILGHDSNNGTLVDPNLIGIFSSSDLSGTPVSSVQTLNAQFVGDDSISYFTPQNAGEYFISVQDKFGGIGTYTVGVDDIGVRDDSAADIGTTGSIAPGGSAIGRIDFAQDEDWFEVSLAANRLYEIELVALAGGNALADPFFRGVYDSNGVLIANTENDDGGDGKSSALQFVASQSGRYYLSAGGFGDSTGQYRLELNDLGVLDNNRFDITIDFASDDVPDAYTTAFESAVERWEDIIIGDLPYAFVEGYGYVDDILIEVAFTDIELIFEGVEQTILSLSTVLDQRSDASVGAGALPTYSRIVINSEEVGDLLNLDEFAMHTLGRALGFGSLWEEFGLVRDIDGIATYTGSNALREIEALSWDLNGVNVLESGEEGGLAAEYWSEWFESPNLTRFFERELMTSRVELRRPNSGPNTSGTPDNPISQLTIAAMQDLGYKVDYGAVDRYFLPPSQEWIETDSGPQLRIDSAAGRSNNIGDITSGADREVLRDIVINTGTGETITFTGEALVADDNDDEVVTVTLSVNGQPLVVTVPLGGGVDTTSPTSIAAAVAVALAADPLIQATASSGVVSVAGEDSQTVNIETVVFALGVNDGGATATLADSVTKGAAFIAQTIFFADDGLNGVNGGAMLKINGANDVTLKSFDTTDADITSLTVDLTGHAGTLTATGGSPAFDGGDSTILLEIINDNDEAGSGGVDLEDGVAQYGSVITFDDPDTSGESENEFGIEYNIGHGETFPFAGVSSLVLEDIDATMHDGVISLGVISEINREEFDLKAGETGQVFACLGTALDDGVLETPTLSASGIWTFDGSSGGYTPAGGLNNLDLEMKNIDIKPGGHLVFTKTDICIIGNIDLSEAVLDFDTGSTIKVGAGGKLTLAVEQVNELQDVLQGIPVDIVGSDPGYDDWAVEQGLMENAGFSDDASGDGFANSFHYAMKIPAIVFIQTDYPHLVPTIDKNFFDSKATLFFQVPDDFREDVMLEVEESTDLQAWKMIASKEGKADWLFQSPNLVTLESLQDGYIGVRVTASGDYAEQSNGFYRLNIRLR